MGGKNDSSLAPEVAQILVDYYVAWEAPLRNIPAYENADELTTIFHDQLFATLPVELAKSLRLHLVQVLSDDTSSSVPSLDVFGAQAITEMLSAEILYDEIENEVLANKGQWEEPVLDNLRKWIAYGGISVKMQSIMSKEPVKRWADTWLQRFDFFACEKFCEMRIEELFDIIVDYPDSTAAINDIKTCLERVQYRSHLVKQLKTLNETRLLHAGASTQLILTQYISTIKCLLIIDPTGVLLASVAEPIRKYLRERPDTIRSIVASFVDEESELVEEGDAQDNAPIVLENDDAPDWEDPNWEPEPIDAGPNFRSDGRKDLISTLVSIYDSKEVFVEELQVMLAQRLMSLKDYNLEKEIRNIEILKLKFGETTLHACEVMLKDVADSKRIDQNIRSQIETVIRPIVVSRQFWPEIEDFSFNLTEQMQTYRKQYEDAYARFKPDKRLHWIPQIGNVSITLDLEDRTLNLDVTPFQATVIDLFAVNGVTGGKMTAQDIEEQLEAPNSVIVQDTLAFWIKKGVLKEEKLRDEDIAVYRVLEHYEATSPKSKPRTMLGLIELASARNCYWVGVRYHCSGLSRGARIGVGVAVAVGVLLLIALFSLLCFCRRRRNLKQQGQAYEQQMYAPYQQNYPAPQMPYYQGHPDGQQQGQQGQQGQFGYNAPPGPPPGDYPPPKYGINYS
ncbi:hypothetical protein E3Q03_01716 [Wallemia mellicola]|uniref:Cullin family profile domain-containing protein n=1 Tax=Wallemia mellicola TaxID=1708541 RepID=A0AB74KJQ0_9BASI|nr:hypothetical protein E3Q03_01716 [Wallemia mellicola]